jgi:DNA-binding beta-propeller fold protein YncE
MVRRVALSLVVAASTMLLTDVAPGAQLDQLPGLRGCMTPGSPYSRERCAVGTAIFAPDSAVVSTDGANVYVAARGPDELVPIGASGVLMFARNARSGTLMELGCVTDDGTDGREGTDGACADGSALESANAIAMSPDGRHVYTTSDEGGIAIFARGADGRLTQAGCVKDFAPASACIDAFAMPRPVSIALSPDGRFVYATSRVSHAVLVFARDALSGALSETSCVSENGSDGACVDGVGMVNPTAIAISPDGRSAYVTLAKQQNGLAVFARDAQTGALTQTACFMSGVPRGRPCRNTPGLYDANGVAVSPDGRNVYVTAIDSDAVATFRRDSISGALTPLDCIADELGFGERCRAGHNLSYAAAVAVTADGRQVVVIAAGSNVISLFDRRKRDGRLRLASCVGWHPTEPGCRRGRGLFGAKGLALSPHGDNAYVTADTGSAISSFAINPPATATRP